jgi:putative phosphoesterase
MRILVISDSHGNYPQALKAHELAGPVDQVIHLGDGAEDASLMAHALEIPVVRVAGNCDMDPYLPLEVTLDLEQCRVFATHGNRQMVKMGLEQLVDKGREEKARVVLYGHTHHAAVQTSAGMLLVNPGALKQGFPPSYAILTIDGPKAQAEIFTF